MVPAANTVGFAGQELARKMPKVLGVLIETTLGSLIEIILFSVLVARGDRNIPVVRAAILGSILANLLLCMGFCFVAGGMRRREQVFHEAVSEVGSNLMLMAGSTYTCSGRLPFPVTNVPQWVSLFQQRLPPSYPRLLAPLVVTRAQ